MTQQNPENNEPQDNESAPEDEISEEMKIFLRNYWIFVKCRPSGSSIDVKSIDKEGGHCLMKIECKVPL